MTAQPGQSQTQNAKIRTVILQRQTQTVLPDIISRDHETALRDLAVNSFFLPANNQNGPYDLNLSIEENRLVFKLRDCGGADLPMLVLSLKPYKRLIKDYFIICNSHEQALRDGKPSRIEAIDMGRRGLHNEGAMLLKERLENRINMDLPTARRLFTLICVLHAGITALRG